jgi:hypothetical protein
MSSQGHLHAETETCRSFKNFELSMPIKEAAEPDTFASQLQGARTGFFPQMHDVVPERL